MIDSLILFIIIINSKIKNKNALIKKNLKKMIKCRFNNYSAAGIKSSELRILATPI